MFLCAGWNIFEFVAEALKILQAEYCEFIELGFLQQQATNVLWLNAAVTTLGSLRSDINFTIIKSISSCVFVIQVIQSVCKQFLSHSQAEFVSLWVFFVCVWCCSSLVKLLLVSPCYSWPEGMRTQRHQEGRKTTVVLFNQQSSSNFRSEFKNSRR